MKYDLKQFDKRLPVRIIDLREQQLTNAEIIEKLIADGFVKGPNGAEWRQQHISILAKQLGCAMSPRRRVRKQHPRAKTAVPITKNALAIMGEILNSTMSDETKKTLVQHVWSAQL